MPKTKPEYHVHLIAELTGVYLCNHMSGEILKKGEFTQKVGISFSFIDSFIPFFVLPQEH